MREAWIIDGVRTPRGKGRETGSLHGLHPQELLAQVLNALAARLELELADVEDVVVGNGSQENEHGSDIGRLAVLTAGWPVGVPGVTLNRFCGSGQQAVAFAAMGVASGMQHLVIAGGVESMSRHGRGSGGWTLDGHNPRLRDRYPMVPQGISADLIATLDKFDREELDAYALRSQQRASTAITDGHFTRSVVPVLRHDGTVALAQDEHPRPKTTLAELAALEPAFAWLGAKVMSGYDRTFDEMALEVYPEAVTVQHVHSAGTSSGVVDGAAAVVVASPEYARATGLQPRARFVAHAVAGSEPVLMLTAPGAACESVLAKARMRPADIDLWEINEAFAVVPLKTMRDLDLEPSRVNVNGGAIALGHPIGATGTVLVQTVLDELERRDLGTGMVTMCTGAGMATASIIERL